MIQDLKLGDVVQPRCGGPHMVVDGIRSEPPKPNTVVDLVWFDGSILSRDALPLASLRRPVLWWF